MSLKVKASELRQQREKLVNEARELVERIEKENRSMSKDEQTRHKELIDQTYQLAERASTIERQIAVDTNGPEPSTRKSDPLPHEDAGNVGTKHRYSLLRAARQLSSKGAEPFTGLEAEVSQELVKRTGKTPVGFMMPYNTSGVRAFESHKRALDTTAAAGAIPTVLDKDWIELLRNQMVVKQAGARDILDLQGKFAIPRQSASATAYWVAESGSPTGSNQTLDQVVFSPKTIGAFTDVSRRFFELTNLDSGEEFVREDLTAILARGVDLAALNGSGSSNQPLGILQNTAITTGRTVALGANGAAPTFQSLVNLATIISRGNAAGLGEMSYIGNADVTGTLATTAKIGSTFPVFLLEDGKVNGRAYYETLQLPNNLTKGSGTKLSPIIAGVFNQIIMAYWSGVDILVDPYTGSSSGTVRIVALQDMDIQVRHNEAFAVIVDLASNQNP